MSWGWTEMCACGPVRLSATLRHGEPLPDNGCWRRPRRGRVALCEAQRLLQRASAAGEWSTKSLMPGHLLDRNLSVEPGVIRDGDAEDDFQVAFVRSLHLFRAG